MKNNGILDHMMTVYRWRETIVEQGWSIEKEEIMS